MQFFQLDVFAQLPYTGNPLAVFPDAADLSAAQMQAIAREMNLSESTFVTRASGSEYDVRIFTPAAELPFAGHPTIGTAWLLSHLGLIEGDELTQHSPAGATPLRKEGEDIWFERTGSVGRDMDDVEELAVPLQLDPGALSIEWDRAVLRPAVTDIGIAQLMVPIADVELLRGMSAPPPLGREGSMGAYCFARSGNEIRARGFFADVGIPEDPATGSAAAGLGLYLGERVGEMETVVVQGVEIGRTSHMRMRAQPGRVAIGGASRLVLDGSLKALP